MRLSHFKNGFFLSSYAMIFIMAWRNIWRNKTRSRVVMGAVMVGIWAAVFMTGFTTGMVKGYVNSAVENVFSHIQVHHPDFPEDRESKYYLDNEQVLLDTINSFPEVKAAGVRSLVNAMISSGRGATGVEVRGIEPWAEKTLTRFDQKIKEGDYFPGDIKNPILISGELAEQLQIKLKRKVVLTFQNVEGEITAGAFRVAGIFDTGNNMYDESHVFVLKDDLNRIFSPAGLEPADLQDSTGFSQQSEQLVHEIAILLKDINQLDAVQEKLRERFPGLSIETYREISPDLELFESTIGVISYIYLILILLALVFGIVNTMLMSVLERHSELGMLMAIGMNKLKIFLMIVFETILLGVAAVPFGIILGFLTITILGRTGINLSMWSESLQEFGMQDFVYPEVVVEVYWLMAAGVFVTTVISSVYPALRAIHLRPVEAIRKL